MTFQGNVMGLFKSRFIKIKGIKNFIFHFEDGKREKGKFFVERKNHFYRKRNRKTIEFIFR